MNYRKVTSTNFENLMELNKCPVTFTLSKTGGRWKALIIYNLVSGKKRYNEIKKGIPNASEKMIIEKLKELESDGLISRKAYPVVPPHVEYALTQKGETLAPICNQYRLRVLRKWSISFTHKYFFYAQEQLCR